MPTSTKNKIENATTLPVYEQTVSLRHLHIAPRKVRLVATAIKGLSLSEAEAQLLLRPQRAAQPIIKLIRSAAANAKSNKNIGAAELYIKGVQVDKASMLKRFLPRAFGRATEIQKKMSHVFLTVAKSDKPNSNRFVIAPRVKKERKKTKQDKSVKPGKENETMKPEATKKRGTFKRFFQRKSV